MNKEIKLSFIWILGMLLTFGSVFGCMTFPEYNISYNNEIGERDFKYLPYMGLRYNETVDTVSILINEVNINEKYGTFNVKNLNGDKLKIFIDSELVYSADVSVVEIKVEKNKSISFFENFKEIIFVSLILGIILGVMKYRKVESKAWYFSAIILAILIIILMWFFGNTIGHTGTKCI